MDLQWRKLCDTDDIRPHTLCCMNEGDAARPDWIIEDRLCSDHYDAAGRYHKECCICSCVIIAWLFIALNAGYKFEIKKISSWLTLTVQTVTLSFRIIITRYCWLQSDIFTATPNSTRKVAENDPGRYSAHGVNWRQLTYWQKREIVMFGLCWTRNVKIP